MNLTSSSFALPTEISLLSFSLPLSLSLCTTHAPTTSKEGGAVKDCIYEFRKRIIRAVRHTDHRATTERGTLTWKRRRRSNLHKLVIALARRVSRVVSNNSRHSHPLPLPNSSASVCYFRFVRSLNSFSTFFTVDDLYKHPPLPPQFNHVCVYVTPHKRSFDSRQLSVMKNNCVIQLTTNNTT